MHRGKTSGNNVVAPTKDDTCCTAVEMRSRERIRCSSVKNADKVGFREMTVRVRYGCSPATVLRGSATFNLVSHCQLKVCMYRAIKKALPLSVCETDTTTVVEVDKGQRFITSVNYVLLIRSSYRSRIANIAIHFEFAKKITACCIPSTPYMPRDVTTMFSIFVGALPCYAIPRRRCTANTCIFYFLSNSYVPTR